MSNEVLLWGLGMALNVAIQAALFSFFMGGMKEKVNAHSELLKQHGGRLDNLDRRRDL